MLILFIFFVSSNVPHQIAISEVLFVTFQTHVRRLFTMILQRVMNERGFDGESLRTFTDVARELPLVVMVVQMHRQTGFGRKTLGAQIALIRRFSRVLRHVIFQIRNQFVADVALA